jgi:hypothetical protein
MDHLVAIAILASGVFIVWREWVFSSSVRRFL